MEFIRSNTLPITIGFGSIVVSSIIWEYIAKRKKSNVKPSVGLTHTATFFSNGWRCLGELAAKISSFYTYLDFREIKEALHDLWKPIIELCFSWFQFFNGYFTTANLYNHPYLISFGSLTLLILLGWLGHYFDVWTKVLPMISSRFITE